MARGERTSWWGQAGQGGRQAIGRRRRMSVRGPLESLEPRVVLSVTSTPSIVGTVFADVNGSGQQDAGETLAGVSLQLYRDNGDGILQTATDTLVETTTTDAAGFYCFDELNPDSGYFVRRPAQTVSGISLALRDSRRIFPGEPTGIIDQFATRQTVAANPPAPSSGSSVLTLSNENEVIGRERDLFVELKSGIGEATLAVNPFGLEELLQIDDSPGTRGVHTVTWDGVDGQASGVSLGLNNRDLTRGGLNSGIVLRAGVDESGRGASLVLRIYNDRTDTFSSASVELPVTGGDATGFVMVPFSQFQGTVNPNQVDAIQMIVDGGQQGADGKIALIGLFGAQRFDIGEIVRADLSVTKSNGADALIPGQTTTYTIVARNAGPDAVTGVPIDDVFSAGLTNVRYSSVIAGAVTGATPIGTGSIHDVVAMGPNSSITYTVVAIVPADATQTIENRVTIGVPPGVFDPDVTNNSATDRDPIGRSVDLTISKDDGRREVHVGEVLTYRINVTNFGPADVVGAKVTDLFPNTLENVTYVSAGSPGTSGNTPAGSGNINDLVNLPVGGVISYVVTATVSSQAIGTLVNRASVDPPAGLVELTPENNIEIDTDLVEREITDLAITKDDGVTTVIPGQSLTYTIVVTNQGPANAARVNVVDDFPAALTNVTYTSRLLGGATGATATGAGSIDDLVDLPAGSSIIYTVTGIVAANATGTLANTATVSGATNDLNPNNNSATDIDLLVPRADLSVTKSDGVSSTRPGETLTYSIVVRNQGPADVRGARVEDLFPSVLTGVTYSREFNGQIVTGSGSIQDTLDLPAGALVTYTVTGVVDASAAGSLINSVRVSPPTDVVDPNLSNNQATDIDTISRSELDVAVRKQADRAFGVPGERIQYTILVSNAGLTAVTGATFVDTFPASLSDIRYTSEVIGQASGNTQGSIGGDRRLSETLSLGVGATVVYRIDALVSSAATGVLQNVAQVNLDEGFDTNPSNNIDIHILPLVTHADLSVTKTDGRAQVEVGETTTYTVVVRNVGPSDVRQVAVVDEVPAGLADVTFTSTVTGNVTGNTATGTGPIRDTVDLPAGSSITYRVTGRVTGAVSGVLVNSARVTGPQSSAYVEINPKNNESTDTDSIASVVVLGSEPTVIRRDLIAEPGTTDRFMITAHDTGKLLVTAHFDHELGNLQLAIDDQFGNPITTVDSSDDDEQLVIPVVSQERYFVRVIGTGTTAPAAYDLEIENFAAPIPQVVRLTPETDSGKSNHDGVTSFVTPTIVVQADVADSLRQGIAFLQPATPATNNQVLPPGAGMAVEVTLTHMATGDQFTGFATAIGAAGNLFSFAPNAALANGEYVVTATVRVFDGKSNDGVPAPATGRSLRSEPFWITIDSVAPTSADRPDLLDASDSGASFRDDVTSESMIAIRGRGEPDAIVRIYSNRIGGNVELVGHTVVNADGDWQATVGPLDDDLHHLRAELEDCAGNISDLGEPLIVEVDTIEPNTPFLDLLRTTDTGLSNADEVTRTPALSFSMTTEDPQAARHLFPFNFIYRLFVRPDAQNGEGTGEEVLIYDSSVDANLPVARVLNGLTDLKQLIRTLPLLPDGVHDFKLEVEDRAGNISHDFLLDVTIDTVVPPADISLLPSSDSGDIAGDRVTNEHSPAYSGASEIGTTVTLYANGRPVGTGVVGSDESDGVVGNGLGAWEITSEPLADGQYSITARFQDLAGNQSESIVQTLWIDSQEPNVPQLDLVTDTGIGLTDNVTRDNTPSITITAADTRLGGANPFPNDIKYRVYDRPGDGTGEVLLIDSFGALRDLTTLGFFTETLPTLADGVHNLKVEIEDRAGNTSHAFLLDVLVDTQAPALAGVQLRAASDAGTRDNDGVTRIPEITLGGFSTPGDRVRIYANGALVGSGLVESDETDGALGNGLGMWEVTTNHLDDGTYQILVEVEDLAGNITRSTPLDVTIDTVRPNIPLLDLITDTGVNTHDNITSATSPVVTITASDIPSGGDNPAPHDIRYRLYDRTGSGTEQLLIDSFATLNDLTTGGFFTHTLNNLSPGMHNLKLEVEDRAGNLSLPFLLQVLIDANATTPNGTIELAEYSDSGVRDDDHVTNIQQPAVLGVGNIGDKVTIWANGELVGEGVVHGDETDGVVGDGRGAWEVTLEPLHDGNYEITARFEDEAGNTAGSNTLRLEVDTLVPNTPWLDLVETRDSGRHDDDNITNAAELRLTATTLDPNGAFHTVLFPGGQNLVYRIYDRPEEGPETLVYDSSTDVSLSGQLDGLTAATSVTIGGLNLAEGWHDLKLEVADRAGNISHDLLLDVLIDRTAFAGTAQLDPTSDSGVAGDPASLTDGVTNVRTPTFVGTAEANALVTLTIDGQPAGTTVAVPFDGDDAVQPPNAPYELAGNWRLTSSRALSSGVHTVVVTYEDPAGNRTTSTLQLTVDTQGPRIVNVTRNEDGFPSLFDPKPSSGPDPLISSVVIHVSDSPTRTGGISYDAVARSVALEEGNYRLVGDAHGNIPIQGVTVVTSVDAGVATARITLNLAAPLLDDRYTLVVSDQITDGAGNRLDGESGARAPFEGAPGATRVEPIFPTGDGVTGGEFVARFTVDSRPEIGTWGAGSVWTDTNGNWQFDPENLDYVNRDIIYRYGFTSDDVFAGNFALPGETTDGFDKLAAYGRAEGEFRWLIDTDNDGVPNIDRVEPQAANGLPVAGEFDGNAANGDEVAVWDGRYWYIDTNHDFQTDARVQSHLIGYPIVGDFDGDGFDDLGTWTDNRFRFDLAKGSLRGWDGVVDEQFGFGFIGVRERPVAADMDQDGFDDLGLWVPDREGITDRDISEWYFLISGGESLLERLSPADDPTDDRPVIDFTPRPFGNDWYARWGDEFALPLVGNFDPPVVGNSSGGGSTSADSWTNPTQALDVNADGQLSPLDVLLILNDLNSNGARVLEPYAEGLPFLDVNQDLNVSPIDALLVLNALNAASESSANAVSAVAAPSSLAADHVASAVLFATSSAAGAARGAEKAEIPANLPTAERGASLVCGPTTAQPVEVVEAWDSDEQTWDELVTVLAADVALASLDNSDDPFDLA